MEKFNYPLKFRCRTHPELVVEFTSLTSGKVVRDRSGFYSAGHCSDQFKAHTDTTTWELMDKKKDFSVHDSIANRFMDLLFLSGACSTEPTGLRESVESLLYDYVIIKRGENRYPYADELHALAEGILCQTRYRNEAWTDVQFATDLEWRVKPTESVYEWQWLLLGRSTGRCRGLMADGSYKTEQEAEEWYEKKIDTTVYALRRIEETQQERTQ